MSNTSGLRKRKEAAAFLGVAPSTLDRYIAEGLPSIVLHRTGRRTYRRFRIADLEAWVATREERHDDKLRDWQRYRRAGSP